MGVVNQSNREADTGSTTEIEQRHFGNNGIANNDGYNSGRKQGGYDNRNPRRSRKYEERESKSNDGDDEEMTPLMKKIVLGLWLGSLGFLIWYTFVEATAFADAGVTTKVQIFAKDHVDFPAITMCNFESNVTLTPASDACRVHTSTENATEPCVPKRITSLAPYDCVTINHDPADTLTTTSVGLKGYVRANYFLNTASYKGGLYGAQIVLHDVSEEPDINLKTFFVPPGKMTVVALRRIETIPLGAKPSDPKKLSWEFEMQYAALPATTPNITDFVSVAFLYKELSVQEITEVEAYSTLDFLGVIAGMIGTMLGFDVFGVSLLITRSIFKKMRSK